MDKPIEIQITAELEQIERDVDLQKKVIKRSIGKQAVIDAAESELKALHTRQSILEENLKKLDNPSIR
jgi:predicted nuclease with TOPRIM domain